LLCELGLQFASLTPTDPRAVRIASTDAAVRQVERASRYPDYYDTGLMNYIVIPISNTNLCTCSRLVCPTICPGAELGL
jgi:hypothetical protein